MSRLLSKSDLVNGQNISQVLQDAWLNIYVDERKLFNPLMSIPDTMEETPEIYFSWLMSRPEYFYFACDQLFNIKLLPFQCAILCEMWNRKFPMLIGSRGLGKSFLLGIYSLLRAIMMKNRKVVICGAAFRQSKVIFNYIEAIWNNSPLLRDIANSASMGGKCGPSHQSDMYVFDIGGSSIKALPIGDGCLSKSSTLTTYDKKIGFISDAKSGDLVWGNNKFRSIDYPFDNKIKPTKIISTRCGYSYEGTFNHAMKVLRNGKINWVRTDQMVIGDRILIDRSVRWHQNLKSIHTADECYALGAMIGDGSWTNDYYLRFTTKDLPIIERVNIGFKLFKKDFVQSKDKVHWNLNSKQVVNEFLHKWNLKSNCYTINKELPTEILKSNKENMTACLQGLFDTDGHLFTTKTKGGVAISINFTNTSKILVQQIQYILLHYGIVSTVTSRNRKNWNTIYELRICGKNVKIFADKINFYLPRKQEALNKAISEKTRWNSFNDDIPITKEQLLSSIDKNKLPQKWCKSKLLKRRTFQIQFLSDILPYCNNPEWKELINPDIFYDVITTIEDSECDTCDIHVPEGNEYCANGFFSHNTKIRGQRANDILSDEFASINIDIFENVIAGFAAVSAAPAENVKDMATRKMAEFLGIELEEQDLADKISKENQIIISGTAYYAFNHFAKYWEKWRSFILSKGDPDKLAHIFPDGVPADFNWKDYSIIRMPVDLLPTGFMDSAQLARSKATIHSGLYQMEFGAVHTSDSQGFFKRSVIEGCVANDKNQIVHDGNTVIYGPSICGQKSKTYVMGIDPAAEIDNFSIVIIEMYESHRRVVYCWTTNKAKHQEDMANGFTNDGDYYSYCAKKIRDLSRKFNVVRIAIDGQGGGKQIIELLHNKILAQPGDKIYWPIIVPGDPKQSDGEQGEHIIEEINFASYEWVKNANHGLRFDLESKNILFPMFDSVSIAEAQLIDKSSGVIDSLEDCTLEIEELKDELSNIIVVNTASNNRERWDTPDTKEAANKVKRGRMRKDRYSALIMANASAKDYSVPVISLQSCIDGAGFANNGGVSVKQHDVEPPKYIGADFVVRGLSDLY